MQENEAVVGPCEGYKCRYKCVRYVHYFFEAKIGSSDSKIGLIAATKCLGGARLKFGGGKLPFVDFRVTEVN